MLPSPVVADEGGNRKSTTVIGDGAFKSVVVLRGESVGNVDAGSSLPEGLHCCVGCLGCRDEIINILDVPEPETGGAGEFLARGSKGHARRGCEDGAFDLSVLIGGDSQAMAAAAAQVPTIAMSARKS